MSRRQHDERLARLRKQLFSSLLALPTLAVTVLRMVDVTSSPALGRVAGFVMMGIGALAGGRVLVHLRDRYWNWHGVPERPWRACQRRRLNWLVVADIAITLVLFSFGMRFFLHPSNWLELGVLIALTLSMVAVSSETVGLARDGGLPRGSETIGNCWLVKWVRKTRKAYYSLPLVRRIDRFVWERRTRIKRASGLVVVMVMMLLGGALTQAVAVAPQVKHYLSKPPLQPNDEHRDNGDVSSPSVASIAPPMVSTPATSTPRVTLPIPTVPLSRSHAKPTYEDLCGPLPPGNGAPPGEAQALEQAWLQLGGVVAGCAQPAQLVPSSDAVYYAVGQCDGALRSLGVVTPDREAAVLLDQPALFARRMALEGKLRGASARIPIGGGDFHVVDTTDGGYVVIREQVTDGRGGAGKTTARCSDIQASATEYVTLPPALADLWLRLGSLGHRTWPKAAASRTPGVNAFEFYGPGNSHVPVATGWCSEPTTCELYVDGISWTTTGGTSPVTTDRVLADGPSS